MGSDVQIVYFRGGTITAMALIARETPISQVSGPPIVSAALKGADAVMVAGGNVVSEYWLMSKPEVKMIPQLKGGSVAIATFGGLSDSPPRIALQKLGLNPAKDVTLVQIGTIPERLSALESESCRLPCSTHPTTSGLRKRGLYKLMEVRLPYQGIGVGTTCTFIRDPPDVVRRYVKSQVEAVHRLKTDREAGIKASGNISTYWTPEVLQKAYDDAITDERFSPTKQHPSWRNGKNPDNCWRRCTPKRKPLKPGGLCRYAIHQGTGRTAVS